MITDEQINQLMSNVDSVEPTVEQRDDSHLLQFTDELTENKVKAKIMKFNTQWDKYSSTYENKLKQYLNAYRNMEVTIEGVPIKVPEVFTLIEVELPHLLNSIFGQSLVVDAKSKFEDPTGEKTYKVKNYINRLIKDTCNGKQKTELIIKNMLIYGWTPVKMFWNADLNQDVDILTGEITSVNSYHPDFDLVDPFCFAFDTNNQSSDIQACEWVRERIFLSKDRLRVMRDNGECAWFDDNDLAKAEDKGRKARNKSDANAEGSYYDEYFCTLYAKNEEGKMVGSEYIVWQVAGQKIVKFQPNPFKRKMHTIVRAYKNPNEFLGMGEPEVIGPLSNQLSLTHYQMGKMTKKVGQSLTVIDPSAGISPENLKRIEEGVIYVQNKAGLSFEQTNDPTNLRVLMEAKRYLDAQIEDVTGIGKTLQGTPVGDMTATQASYLYQASSNRLAIKLSHLQEELIKVLAQNFFLISKQFLQEPIDFFDTNNNLMQLEPMDLMGNYDWIPMGSITQANKALQLQQNQQLLMGLINLMQASQQTANPFTLDIPYYVQQYLAPYANIPDASKFIIPQAPMPPAGMVPSDPAMAGNNPPLQGQIPPLDQLSKDPGAIIGALEGQANNIQA